VPVAHSVRVGREADLHGENMARTGDKILPAAAVVATGVRRHSCTRPVVRFVRERRPILQA